MTVTLTDEIPEVMSNVLREATIVLKDAMPSKMRNSPEFKSLLFDMAGTGCEREVERLNVLTDWMFDIALPQVQGLADDNGFGEQWRAMCEERTPEAADDASFDAANDSVDAAIAAARAASVAIAVAVAVETAAIAAASSDFWENVDPVGVLQRMTHLEVEPDQTDAGTAR